ncbi:hypothetical protein N7452_006691 [Penicillium brevicompactum]|uniref:N2227-domain-containing protein n=1 Tax=Penicillium brevicompactum TaxID=5074 RepID=A0A9W9UG82_PENBR|nr:hypothetical protein N7452_006691 [Penicillium brevicompactum]
MVYSVRRQVLLILACVAWIEFAIRYSPQIERFAHNVLTFRATTNHEIAPLIHGPEKHARLLQTLDRSSGKWDSSHPRHRLLAALYGFASYENGSRSDINRWKDLYKKVPKRQRLLLESSVNYPHKLESVEKLLKVNVNLARSIADHGLRFYNITQLELDEFINEAEAQGKPIDKTSVTQGMKHFVRDWSTEGKDERTQSFQTILDSLNRQPRTTHDPLRVLLPGAGLGRLAHEIHSLGGYQVTTNEWSAYMNLAYRYLSSQTEHNSLSFHPYIDWWSHHATNADFQRSVTFPDQVADPSSVLHVEGDFTTAFSGSTGQYDVMVTLFFIDTARNLISYIENIHRLLRPGGLWINLGPLMYGTGPFVQLTVDEIVALSTKVGFEFRETDANYGNTTIPGLTVRGSEISYGRNPEGLNKNAFQAQYWEAVRV